MPAYPKRLIEVDLPIRRISDHARREKSIRHGHISTLHIWWARRPLAACRAVLCASLWPDTAPGKNDAPCPPAFLAAAIGMMQAWTTHERQALLGAESRPRFEKARQKPALFDDPLELRHALLDFIADFANWDNSTVPAYLDTARYLTAVAHRALTEPEFTLNTAEIASHLRDTKTAIADWPKPLVVDPFAGGGSIPLEALRVGADAFASDLNPIPVLLNKVVLEYIPKYGQRLADEVRKWGDWIKEQAEKELAGFYPKDPDGSTPIAYLWARVIQCEGPGCGAEVPLMRTLLLAKRPTGNIGLKFSLNRQKRSVGIDMADNPREIGRGTMKAGSVTCPLCDYTTPSANVRLQLSKQNGGANTARLYAVVLQRPGVQGRFYRVPTELDSDAIAKARKALMDLEARDSAAIPNQPLPPERPSPNARGLSPVSRIGVQKFRQLFSERPLLSLSIFTSLIRKLGEEIVDDSDLLRAVTVCLAFAVDKQADFNSSLSRWANHREGSVATFGRHALPVLWDWGEVIPLRNSTGSFSIALDFVLDVISHVAEGITAGKLTLTTVAQSSATKHPLPGDSSDALVTDPPYYDAVPYADLSDYFYVWLRRGISRSFPDLSECGLTPKDDEAIWNPSRRNTITGAVKDESFYENQMSAAFAEGRRYTKPGGIGVVVFAHKSTEGWEAILQALIDAGWVATGSWPIDTEKSDRMNAQGTASLASSVHIVCRPREDENGNVRDDEVGDWRDVLQELPRRIHEWMPRLDQEGVVGADAIFACLGPALEVFSRYSRVERASGEQVTLKEYLEHVWAAVSREALTMVFKDADVSGFEEDARLTAIWLWTLSTAAQGKDLSSRVNKSLNDGDDAETEEDGDDDEDDGGKKKTKLKGFYLDYDAARKIAQGLGAHLEDMKDVVEVKGDTARLLPVAERTARLFGKADPAATPAAPKKKKVDTQMKLNLFDELTSTTGPEAETAWEEKTVTKIGETTLDRVHQSMILFAAGRSEALKRFLVDDGAGKDPKFWRLAQALSALYPQKTDERRWVEGVMARKKGLGV